MRRTGRSARSSAAAAICTRIFAYLPDDTSRRGGQQWKAHLGELVVGGVAIDAITLRVRMAAAYGTAHLGRCQAPAA